ncbi:MAG: hypothetical protein ACFFBD_21910, partial [Candidatus Hodarchaeota archaeon]
KIENLEKYSNLEVLEATGSLMITRLYDSSQINNIKFLPSEFIYPITLLESKILQLGLKTTNIKKKLGKAYTIHYFEGSWLSRPGDRYFTIDSKNLKPIFITLNLPISGYPKIFPKINSGKGDIQILKLAKEWLEEIRTIHLTKKIFIEPGFSKLCAELLFIVCFKSRKLGLVTWKMFWQSPLSNYNDISLKRKLQFVFIALFHNSISLLSSNRTFFKIKTENN